MSELLKYSGMDLPEYFHTPEHPIAWTKQQIKSIAQMAGNTAVRRVFFTPSSLKTLNEVVDTADELFEEVADLCDASVVPHTWGLAKYPDSFKPSIRQPLLPPGMELVAEVDIIRGSRLPNCREAHDMRSKLYERELSRPQIDWRDDHTHQFLHGTDVVTAATGMWLVDIEPVLRIRGEK